MRARDVADDGFRASQHAMKVFAALSLGLMGCGGTDDGRPAAGPETAPETEPVDWCEVAGSYDLVKVMDFEPTDVTTALCNPLVGEDGPSCKSYWNYGDNCHKGGVDIIPQSNTEGTFGGDPIPGGRCGAPSQGFHVITHELGFCDAENGKVGWGANAQLEALPIGRALPGGSNCEHEAQHPAGAAGLDASCWEGVAFWARRGEGPSGTALTLAIGDPSTNPGSVPDCKNTDSPTEAGQESSDTSKCDTRGIVVTLSDDWQFFTVPFDDLEQKGYGVRVSEPLDKGNLVKMQFLIAAGDWDLWLDDVFFYKTRL